MSEQSDHDHLLDERYECWDGYVADKQRKSVPSPMVLLSERLGQLSSIEFHAVNDIAIRIERSFPLSHVLTVEEIVEIYKASFLVLEVSK